MDKDEALRLALKALEYEAQKGNDNAYQFEREAIKAALEANEFNPDWDTQAVLTEEIQRMAKRIEELEAKDEPYALEASMFSNDRVKVDPVTGNVSIGTAQQEAKDEPVKVAHRHEWFRTGEMKVGQMRCISCGTWAEEEMPHRTWVGLTADEMLEALRSVDAATAVNLLMSQYKMPPTFKVYAEAIEAKLKEKNGC
jgi:hypothetical protein